MRRWFGRRLALWMLALAASCAGCSGRGTVQFIELDFKRLPDQEPLIARHDSDACWWWMEGERVCVSLCRSRGPALGRLGKRQLDFSLALEGRPADRARDYVLDRSALRCYVHEGSVHSRYASIRGIAGIRINADSSLSVRLRAMVAKQSFHILTGWQTTGQSVIVGEFRAVENEQAGRPILERTEEDGMARAATPGSDEGVVEEANDLEQPDQVNKADDRPRPKRVEGPPVTPDE